MSRRQQILLLTIVILGLALRVAYLGYALASPGYVWQDPDGYADKALRLVGADGWRWTFHAVTHTINGQQHALPPLYSVFLSLFALFPGFPVTALIAQQLLGVLAIGLVFALGQRLHSIRAGLIASAAFAVWVPGVFGVWSTSQETVYLPLVLGGFVLLLRAVDRHGSPVAFGLAGLVFGLAALTRSMPLFFVLPAAGLHVAMATVRRVAAVQAAAFILGFLVLTAPYSAALSRHFGQLSVIDTHGSIHFQVETGRRAPGVLETAAGLWREFASAPAAYTSRILTRARSVLHVNGGRQAQIYVVAKNRLEAVAWKVGVHLGNDLLLIASVVLAGFGAVCCRRPRLAAFILLWAFLNLAIASIGGFGGARLRVPFEPLLFALAAVVVSGEWRRPPMAAAVLAGGVSVLAAAATLPQVPVTLAAWPDYGVRWPSIFERGSGQLTASEAGLNVLAPAGIATFEATAAGPAGTTLEVRSHGIHVRTVHLEPGETEPVRVLWPAGGLAFIELGVSTDPTQIHIDVDGR